MDGAGFGNNAGHGGQGECHQRARRLMNALRVLASTGATFGRIHARPSWIGFSRIFIAVYAQPGQQ